MLRNRMCLHQPVWCCQSVQFRVRGWTRPGPTPKESDGVEYDLGGFDLKEEAEAAQRWRLEAGWGRVAIIDRDEASPARNGPRYGEGLYDVVQRLRKPPN